MNVITIAIDAMGGDIGPSVTVPAALDILKKYPYVHLILVGDKKELQLLLKPDSYPKKRLSIYHASQKVEMDEIPRHALRNKKDSSMRIALELLKEGKAQACVSAGNTGALLLTGTFVLKTLHGVDTPAIISMFPTLGGMKKVRLLDSGANVDLMPVNLEQFAIMGSVLASAVDNIENPKVFLLNIGKEEIKGNTLVKSAAELLSKNKAINYAGFIEGDAIFSGEADVVVCDGFVGNVVVKTSEGVAIFISSLLKEAFMRNFFTKFVGLLAKPVLKAMSKRIDPARYNGATLIGLKGTVVKSHGNADARAFFCAIQEAIIGVEKNVPKRIQHEVEKLLKSSEGE